MADQITHIRGDTFRVTGQFTGGDYREWSGRSQVRNDTTDEKLSDLTFSWIDGSLGLFVVEVLETSNWPANKFVLFDVEITSTSGEIRSSDTVKIQVLRDATHG